jgi:hypothetical protein
LRGLELASTLTAPEQLDNDLMGIISLAWRRTGATALALMVTATALLGPLADPLQALDPPAEELKEETERRRSRPDRRLYLGMWTIHFRDLERGVDDNQALGLAWGALYGATFVNSYGNRAYTAGVQGPIVGWQGRLSLGLGYRAGVISGYDERFLPLAEKTPLIPFLQPRLTLDTRRGGVELSYSGVIASAALSMRF